MPDTFFTSSPHWGWYIVAYFFVGGIAGGAFFVASLLHLFGRVEDRPVVRLGHYLAFAGALLSGALLTLDLTRPLRFWHMLIASNTGGVMFKPWSPMSVGAWGLLLFSGAAALAAAGSMAEEGRIKWPPARALGQGIPGLLLAAAGSTLGFFLAGYTGVLLAVTNRPIWADSPLLGAVFLCSAASTGAAAVMLLAGRSEANAGAMARLSRFDRGALALELLALAAFVWSLGAVARVLVSWWGLALLVGVVVLGIAVPLTLEARGAHQPHTVARAASLVLAGGLLLRMVVIFSSNEVHVTGAGIALP
jgi:formate-dependent nitrite reductase membrane component NrfD